MLGPVGMRCKNWMCFEETNAGMGQACSIIGSCPFYKQYNLLLIYIIGKVMLCNQMHYIKQQQRNEHSYSGILRMFFRKTNLKFKTYHRYNGDASVFILKQPPLQKLYVYLWYGFHYQNRSLQILKLDQQYSYYMSKTQPSEESSPRVRPRKLSRVQSLAPPPLKVRKISQQYQNISVMALGPALPIPEPTHPIDNDHDFLAYLLQAMACLIWTSSYIYTNQHDCDVFQIIIAKGVIGTIFNYIIIRYKSIHTHFEQPRIFTWLLIINVCILAYFYTLPLSQSYLPLPVVHTIGCSSIALVYIIDYFMNGTKITQGGFVGVVLALTGVLLMANNRLIMSLWDDQYVFDSSFGNYHPSSVLFSSLIALILFVSRVFNTYGLVKLKSFPEISVFQLNYHNNIVSVFTGGFGYMLKQQHTSMSVFWPSLITIGVGQFVCMNMFFYSLKLTKKTGNVMIINGLNILFAFIISYFRYDEKINQMLIAGATCLMASMVIVIVQTQKLKNIGQTQLKKAKSLR